METRMEFVKIQTITFRQHLNIHTLPVNMIEVCKAMGWLVMWSDELEDGLDSILMHFRGRYAIFLNEEIRNTFQVRWSLSHEAGHIVLAHFMDNELSFHRAYSTNEGIIWDLNREADIFAAEFLMPSYFIKSNYRLGAHSLAQICGVPIAMMKSRIEELKFSRPSLKLDATLIF